MHQDDPHNLLISNTEASLAPEIVERLLSDRLRDTISPLSLEIDCAALKNWSLDQAHERFRHQNLIKELRLWSNYLHRRPVNRLWINDPFTLMDAPNLTELIYAIGQNMRLRQGHHIEHTISMSCHALTRQNVALLRGLEFNHIQVKLLPDCTLEQMQELKALLVEFKFTFISFEIDVNKDPSLDALRIMEILSFLTPDTLYLHPSQLDINGIEHLTPMLMQFGYYFQAPNLILKFHSPLHTRPGDCIRLGPGSSTSLNGLRITNLSSSEAYATHLKRDLLPIARCF